MKAKSKPIAVILIRSGSRGLVDKKYQTACRQTLGFLYHRSRSSLQAI